MPTIQPPPISTPMMLESGVMSRAWVAWFQSIHLKFTQGKDLVELYDTLMSEEVHFTASINASHSLYEIELNGVLLSSLSSSLLLRGSTDSGASYIEVANGYRWKRSDDSEENYSSIQLIPATSNNQLNYEISGTIRIYEPSNELTYKHISWELTYLDVNNVLQIISGFGQIKTTEPINAFRVIPSAGSITSGSITLYSIY